MKFISLILGLCLVGCGQPESLPTPTSSSGDGGSSSVTASSSIGGTGGMGGTLKKGEQCSVNTECLDGECVSTTYYVGSHGHSSKRCGGCFGAAFVVCEKVPGGMVNECAPECCSGNVIVSEPATNVYTFSCE